MRVLPQIGVVVALAVLGAGGWFLLAQSKESPDEARGAAAASIPVEVVTAERGPIAEIVEAVGTLRANRSVDIVATVSGRLVRIAVGEGEAVAEGELLFELDAERERAAVLEAEADLQNLQTRFERANQLVARNALSQAESDDLGTQVQAAEARLEAARAALADRRITAPFDGVAGLREVSVGAFVDDGVVLTTLDDLTTVDLEFSVAQRFFGQVRAGMPVEADSTAFPGETFAGRVTRIGTRIDPESRSFRVRAELPNPERRLPDGLFMAARLILDERQDRILVPREALIVEGGSTFVFTAAGGVAARTEVEVGRRLAEAAEILSGLREGDLVVVKGQQRLRDGAEVAIRNEPAPAPPTS
jgi:membrane fusion protein, multidrug efflux system